MRCDLPETRQLSSAATMHDRPNLLDQGRIRMAPALRDQTFPEGFHAAARRRRVRVPRTAETGEAGGRDVEAVRHAARSLDGLYTGCREAVPRDRTRSGAGL